MFFSVKFGAGGKFCRSMDCRQSPTDAIVNWETNGLGVIYSKVK